ncbi:CheY-like chemotaxis protein [Catenulispora sp. GP43]|uniref:response regulator n=1 Tax=Catenulispora sp. GP43 TaxID=3156263 RepID=UPI0035173E9C
MPGYPRDILLVEDDEADALLIQDALEQFGDERTVTHIEDGVAALAHLRTPGRVRPDLIVMDLNMPRMNGHELLKILKTDSILRTVPVVVLTTSSLSTDIEAAYANHANAYVTKPVTLDEFTHAVQSIDEFFLRTATTPAAA